LMMPQWFLTVLFATIISCKKNIVVV